MNDDVYLSVLIIYLIYISSNYLLNCTLALHSLELSPFLMNNPGVATASAHHLYELLWVMVISMSWKT